MFLQVILLCTILEFLFALYLFKGDILSPAIAFNGIFVLAAMDLLLMQNYWDVKINSTTLTVILLGTISFTITSWIVNNTRMPILKINGVSIGSYEDNCNISNRFLLFAIVIYVVTILGSIVYVIRNKGLSVALSTLLLNYTKSITAGEKLDLPAILSISSTFCSTAGYVWGYLLSQNWVITRKINIKLLLLFALSCLMGISTGKRGELIALVASFVVCLIISLKKNYSRNLSRKLYMTIGSLIILVGLSFQGIATMMGRDSDLFSPFEYFSIYLGAPILNLNTSIEMNGFRHPVFLSETFHSLYRSVGENFGIDKFIYSTDRIFFSSPNGKRVGNVATVFFDFYHDGGFLGVIVLSAIMAIIAQSIYKKIKKGYYKNRMYWTIVYSYIFWLIVRSFFANSLFDWFTLSSIYTLSLWWTYSIVIPKIKERKRRA